MQELLRTGIYFCKLEVNLPIHLCLYFLMDISETDILSRGNKFSLQEGNHTHDFEWLEFERLEKEYFYPLFLKKEIFHLPEKFTIRTECE